MHYKKQVHTNSTPICTLLHRDVQCFAIGKLCLSWFHTKLLVMHLVCFQLREVYICVCVLLTEVYFCGVLVLQETERLQDRPQAAANGNATPE